MIRMIASRTKTEVKKKLNIFNVYCNSYSNRRLSQFVNSLDYRWNPTNLSSCIHSLNYHSMTPSKSTSSRQEQSLHYRTVIFTQRSSSNYQLSAKQTATSILRRQFNNNINSWLYTPAVKIALSALCVRVREDINHKWYTLLSWQIHWTRKMLKVVGLVVIIFITRIFKFLYISYKPYLINNKRSK